MATKKELAQKKAQQQAFNKVWRWFIVDKRPMASAEPGKHSECLYRGPDGARCPVGVLIPNRLYLPKFENTPVCSIAEVESTPKELRNRFKAIGVSFLDSLQEMHDNEFTQAERRSDIKRLLKEFACDFDLTVPK